MKVVKEFTHNGRKFHVMKMDKKVDMQPDGTHVVYQCADFLVYQDKKGFRRYWDFKTDDY